MPSPEPIKIGVLHSTSGTMALNETSLRDVILMEVTRVNAGGGLLGRPIHAVVRDPASDWMLYRDMAHELIHQHSVAALFGCWTSISRKSVLPVVENADSLLFYPTQYEGEEQSPNIFYMGATPNQQAIPALEFLMSAAAGAFSRFFFLGTDYVYPHTTNRVLRSFLQAKGLPVDGFPEHYVAFGHHDWTAEMEALRQFRQGGRGAIISTLNGDSNLGFYRAMRQAGFRAEDMPVMAFSVSEAELQQLDPDDVAGHYTCWRYLMSHPAPANAAFLDAWQSHAGPERPVYDPMESSVIGFRLWCKAVSKAGTTATPAVRQYMLGQSETTLTGDRCVMGVNHHLTMTVRVGRANRDRQFEIVWQTPRPISGDPWAAENLIADASLANAQRNLLDLLPTPLLVIDDAGTVRYRSSSTHDYFGPEIQPAPLAALRGMIGQRPDAIPADGTRPLPEICFPDADGHPRHMTVAIRRMLFAGDPAHLLSLADVTYIREIEDQLRVLNGELHRMATTDFLTGINNRRYFFSAVAIELKRMRRHRRPATLFLLDLDHFKGLNDHYGHDVGDQALIQAATRIRQLLRGNDIFARVGGEEFAGFLPETGIESALATAERLRQEISDILLRTGSETTHFTCSIGLTAVDPDSDTPETALKRADEGLYAAKREGRNRVLLR